MDLVFSRHLFHGRPVIALAPDSPTVWLLYPDRLIRIDRTLFTDPEASEVFDLDDPAIRQEVGNGLQIGLFTPPENLVPDYFVGDRYFSPDERYLFATTESFGSLVVDLELMEIVRVILGRIAGYNRVANHLFFANGIGLEGGGTEVLVVDATTRMEVAVVPLANPLGMAAVPGTNQTILVGAQLSSGNVMVPFVKVVDGTGAVIVDERARDYLGLDEDPEPGAPSFDQSGEYFMIGSAAFRVLPGGGFEPVPRGIEAGDSFQQRMQGNGKRAVDPVNLFELWYGSEMTGANVGLLSLAGTNLPVAVRPSVPTTALLLDQARGRAIFWGVEELVLIHYADPSAAGRDERLDRSDVTAPFVAEGAVCSMSAPCPGTELCAGATDTAFSGRCTANPRLPFLPYCGGFTQLPCDDGYTCELLNPTNPNSIGYCLGYPYRDYAAHGPACGPGLFCPAGMLCGAGSRCEPKLCLFDVDCGAYPGEICGQLDNIGRVCLAPGPLPDGAPCTGPDDCAHGVCAWLRGAWASGEGDLLYGPYGLGVCTRPCFQNADCPQGEPCLLEQTGFGTTLGADCDDNAAGIIGAYQANGCPQGWVHIPAGSFQMGCNIGELGGDCFNHEQPRHTVTLSAYCLQMTEVSVAEYRACHNGGLCTGAPTETSGNSFCNWTPAAAGREDHPINCVDWAESQQYCQTWLGGDLPTEAQWEKAARGADPDQRKYPWGDTPLPDCTRCNYDVNGAFGAGAGCGSVTIGPATWPVDFLQTSDGDSAYGLKGMAGNVGEWTLDYGSSSFYSQCTSGCTDPLNTTPGTGRREVRGGSYANTTAEILILRVVERSAYTATVRLGNIGFRCRRTP